MSRTQPRTKAEPLTVHIDSMTHDGRGVAHVEGRTLLVAGVLPGEEVSVVIQRKRKDHDEATVAAVLRAAPERVEPRCAHFGVCGGCSLQHMAAPAQIHAKQQTLLENLEHIGKVAPGQVLPPLTGPHWGYRRRARLGVKYVRKKAKVLVGFREKQGRYLADLARCEVLHPAVGERLTELGALIQGLAAFERIPQIEVAVGDAAVALVFRNLEPLSEADQARLKSFGEAHGMQIYLQPQGPDSAYLLWPEAGALSYRLPEFDIELFFRPTDFTQVNAEVNRHMVSRAVDLLDPQPHERVLDLFCGIGNFTLPLARRAAEVVGVEGDAALIERARANAQHNGIGNVRFLAADLAAAQAAPAWGEQAFDKVLLDPPRTGADAVLGQVAATGAGRIVYVSCNPATLARDAGILVHDHGYRLVSAGVMDMFPHTAHVESIAVFE